MSALTQNLLRDEVDPEVLAGYEESHAVWTDPNAKERAEERFEDDEDICNIVMGLAPWSVVYVEIPGRHPVGRGRARLDAAALTLHEMGLVRRSLRSHDEFECGLFGPICSVTERDVIVALGASGFASWGLYQMSGVYSASPASVELFFVRTELGSIVVNAYGPLVRVNGYMIEPANISAARPTVSYATRSASGAITTAERLLRGAWKDFDANLQVPALRVR